jgi:predicted dehydrogenase
MKPVPAQSLNRRTFLRQAATAGSLAVATPLWNACSSTGSATASRRPRPTLNDRLRIGFIGLGGRARWILKNEELPGADVVAAADCFLPRLDEASRQVAGGDRWRKYQYYQDMLAKEQLDAVFVETTTHARVLIAIHAMQAGLDVYAEKPQSLTVQEGRVLVQAARKYRRIIQTGSQQRSMPINRYASDLVRTGALGRIHTVITCNFQGPKKWVRKEETPNDMPAGLDWDQWCNQTALRPYYMDLQFKWGELEDYDGGGQMWGVTGWGTHSLDQVQCALGTDDTGPVEIWPEPPGGPDCKVTLRYANGTLLKLEGANRSMDDLGAIFVGEHGRIEILRGDFTSDRPELKKDAPPPTPQGNRESIPHIQNFFDSIRSRKKPNADAETGHRATTLCHLINICRTVQRRLRWDPKREQFRDDPAANALLARPRRAGYELPRIA